MDFHTPLEPIRHTRLPRSEIWEYAKSLAGMKYLHQGKNDFGVDCVGLPYKIAEHFGFDRVNIKVYGRQTNTKTLLEAFDSCADEVIDLEIGSVVICWLTVFKVPRHSVIYGGNGEIVHADMAKKQVVHTTWNDFWCRRIYRIYDFRWPR